MASQLLHAAPMVTALGLVSLVVVGQTAFGTITTTVGGQQTSSVPNDPTTGVPDCSNLLTATWSTTLTGTPCSSFEIWVTSASECSTGPVGTDLVVGTIPQSDFVGMPMKTGTVQFTVQQMVGAGSDAGTFACGTKGFEATFLVCAAISMDLSSLCTTKQVVQTAVGTTPPTAAEIRYDTKPPGAPKLTQVDPLDSKLSVTFVVDAATTDTTNDFVFVQIKAPTDADFHNTGNGISAGVSTTTITGLTNGVTYEVRVITQDQAGNNSDPSNVLPGTPVASSGFWGAYRADGGGAQGCSAAPGTIGVALVLLMASLWLKRRRS
jgi:uncharacterized protein (TIGR03382 family)